MIITKDHPREKCTREWHGLLDPDGVILWQNRPATTWVSKTSMLKSVFFGTLFISVGSTPLFLMTWGQLLSIGGLVSLFFLTMGVKDLFWGLCGDMIQGRYRFYTLTNKRALIGSSIPLFKKRLTSYRITHDTTTTFKDGKLPSVFFATETKHRRKHTEIKEIGFACIDAARNVLQLLRNIQKDQA